MAGCQWNAIQEFPQNNLKVKEDQLILIDQSLSRLFGGKSEKLPVGSG